MTGCNVSGMGIFEVTARAATTAGVTLSLLAFGGVFDAQPVSPSPKVRTEAERQEALEQYVREMVDRQVRDLTPAGEKCVEPKIFPKGEPVTQLLVKNHPWIKGSTKKRTNTNVVFSVTFDQGWKMAEAGEVDVVAACYKK